MAAFFISTPNFFQWSLNVLPTSAPIPSSFSQEAWLSYLHILRNCCRLALFANSPLNSWPCVEEGESGNLLHWKPWEELELICNICSVEQSDKLMVLNQDFFPLVGKGLFISFWRLGSMSSSFTPNGYFWSKEGWQHWHIPPGKGPWVSEGLLELGLRILALLTYGAGTIKDLQTPSLLQASCQLWAAAAEAILSPPLPRCDMSADLAWPFARNCLKRRMSRKTFGWEGAERCLLERRGASRRS